MGVLTEEAIRLLQGKNLAYLGTTDQIRVIFEVRPRHVVFPRI